MRKSFTHEGQRHFIRCENETDFEVKKALLIRDLEEGRVKITKNTLVRDWAKEWLATYKKETVAPSTHKGIESHIRAHVLPEIGTMPLKDVKPVHCQRILNKLAGKSSSLVRKVSLYMAEMFRNAEENRLMTANPAKSLPLPKTVAGTHRAITARERELLLQVCETHRYGLWALVMLYCGVRPGETERIMGKHIDMSAKTLYVDGTKSKAAKRNVPIPDALADRLTDAARESFRFVFENKDGRPINKTGRKRMWRSVVRAMNVAAGCRVFRNEVLSPFAIAEDFVPYCLRHTYCTDLQAAGVPINVAKELMGHTSIAMTANIYTHGSPEAFENARDLINKCAGTRAGVGKSVEKQPFVS